jgi:hypothetical protein
VFVDLKQLHIKKKFMVMLEPLLKTGNCICGLSNAASSTVAKRVLTFGSTDEAASFIFVY